MGIVIKQSIQNTIITYIGFAIGAANTILMYPYFLGDKYLGIANYILATGNILYPFMSFGIQNTLIKFFNQNKTKAELDGFMTFMLIIPLLLVVPFFGLGFLFYENIASFEAHKNPEIYPFVWIVPLIGLFIGYFEIFYAWLRAHMKSVFGGFVKEVFIRILVTIFLFGVYYKYISKDTFIYLLLVIYLLALIVIMVFAFRVKSFSLNWNFPINKKEILVFSTFIILSACVANMLLDIDKYMISKLMLVDNIAFYTTAIYMANVVSVPSKAMHQITYPLTAKLMSDNNYEELNKLYKKSSITLQVIGGLILAGVLVNLNEIYTFLPKHYAQGISVVFIIGASKYFDLLLGINNAIVFNSRYYKAVLIQGVFLVLILIGLNLWLIPLYGINGSAWATLISLGIYSLIKLFFVVWKMKLYPFTAKNFVSLILFLLTFLVFNYWSLPFHPFINIILKSLLVSLFYLGSHYAFKVSSDVNFVMDKYLNLFLKFGGKSK